MQRPGRSISRFSRALLGAASAGVLVCAGAALAQVNVAAPSTDVAWSSVLAEPGRAQLEQALEKPFAAVFDARKPGLTTTPIRTCRALLALGEGYSAAGTQDDARAFEAQRVRCRVIRLLLAARPAKTSALGALPFDDDAIFASLPAAMIPASDSGSNTAGAWRSRDPKIKVVGKRGDRLVAETPSTHVSLTPLGRGDIDGDGTLDLIVERTGTARDATWSQTQAFVLTRRKPGAPLVVLQRVD